MIFVSCSLLKFCECILVGPCYLDVTMKFSATCFGKDNSTMLVMASMIDSSNETFLFCVEPSAFIGEVYAFWDKSM